MEILFLITGLIVGAISAIVIFCILKYSGSIVIKDDPEREDFEQWTIEFDTPLERVGKKQYVLLRVVKRKGSEKIT